MATTSDENTGPTQVSTTTVLLVLSSIFVCLRFWARWNVAAKYGLDDYLIVAGLVSRSILITLSNITCQQPTNHGYPFSRRPFIFAQGSTMEVRIT